MTGRPMPAPRSRHNVARPLPVLTPVDEHYRIPLRALSIETESQLCTLLERRCHKLAQKCPMLSFADVRGAIVALGYNQREDELLCYPSPAQELLRVWRQDIDAQRPSSVGMLLELLHQLERYDILYEVGDLLGDDLDAWRAEQKLMADHERSLEDQGLLVSIVGQRVPPPQPVPGNKRPTNIIKNDTGVTFDAVFSYDSDSNYAHGMMHEMYDVLSGQRYRFQLCRGIKELRPGVMGTDGFMTLVDERCRHVIVLLTKGYLESEDYKFQLHFSRIKDRMAYRRKVIPVLLENVQVPNLLVDIVCVNFFRVTERSDCYRSIADALRQDD